MIEYSIPIAKGRLVARCEKDLSQHAQALLQRFASLTNPAPSDGMIVEFGWAPLTLKGVGLDLYICEPDFSGNPFTDSRQSVDSTLRVLAGQANLLNRFGLSGAPPRFDQKVIFESDALLKPDLILKREIPDRADDSGWSIQGREASEDTSWTVTFVYKLAVEHLWITAPLALPAPMRCVVGNRQVESIVAGLDP